MEKAVLVNSGENFDLTLMYVPCLEETESEGNRLKWLEVLLSNSTVL